MNTEYYFIKRLIKYLTDVYNEEKIERLNQSFFISNKELDKILREYYIFFKNEKELLCDLKYNYKLIKEMSFPYEKEDVMYARDLSIENYVSHTQKEHNRYSHRIHSRLIEAFEGELKKVKNVINDYENPYPEYFNSYGYEIYKDFISHYKQEGIVLAEMSFLVDRLKKDGLMNKDKTLISIFHFMTSEFDPNFGTATKFKSDFSTKKYLPLYKEIKKRYDTVPK